MTPLLRSIMRSLIDKGQDPTEMHWFDATGCLVDKTEVKSSPLMDMRPPFERCIVCSEAASTHHERLGMHMITSGADPAEGITVSVWRVPPRGKPVASPMLVYAVEDGLLKYGPADENDPIGEDEMSMILGFVASWLQSLSRRPESYALSIAPTYTNRRKMAQGKSPTYTWHTVIIEPSQIKREHQGGTHTSPRQHDRRGHLRRLRSGKNVWVRACVVGDASKGGVFKDYQC